MVILISDTNVFVALFNSNLLFKIFSNQRVEVKIPAKIYEELTNSLHRIRREYPPLSDLIVDIIHNPNHQHPINLKKVDVTTEVFNPIAVETYLLLDEDGILDQGEREAIPLAIELSATFITCDQQALDEYHLLEQKNNSTAMHFELYCRQLHADHIITEQELQLILTAMTI